MKPIKLLLQSLSLFLALSLLVGMASAPIEVLYEDAPLAGGRLHGHEPD